jgi:hypothetical protein
MMDEPLPSINSSALKNLSFLDIARLDEFFDHAGIRAAFTVRERSIGQP